MKRVAIIAPDFSPSSLPPALRVRFFAHYLPEFGWEPVVITTDPKYYDWSVNPESDHLLPEGLKVIRTAALPHRLARKFGFGDVGIRSLRQQWQALKELCRREKVDAVLVPVPPYPSMILARWAYNRFRIPYVIDYIDPWMRDDYWKLPGDQRPPRWPLVWLMARGIEPYTLRKVGHITGVSRGTTDIARRLCPGLREADATEIPYGGHLPDFDYIRRHPRKNPIFDPQDGRIHLSYVGVFIPAMHATVRALFAAVRRGLDRTPELFGRLQFNFVGTTYEAQAQGKYQVLPLAREAGVEHLLNEHPPRVSVLDAIQVQTDSHALLAIGSDAPHYTASKIFPYVLARRPVLALFHEESSVVRIVAETGVGQTLTYSAQRPLMERVSEIEAAVEGLIHLPPGYQPPANWGAFEAYTTRAMTGRLASALDLAVDKTAGRS